MLSEHEIKPTTHIIKYYLCNAPAHGINSISSISDVQIAACHVAHNVNILLQTRAMTATTLEDVI